MARYRGRRSANVWDPLEWHPFGDETGRQAAADISRRMARVMREVYPRPTVLERWAYSCTWYDEATGIEFGSYLYSVVLPAGSTYQKASRDARALAAQARPACISRLAAAGHNMKLRCARAGPVIMVR